MQGGNAAQFDLVETTGGHDWALVSWGSAAAGGTIPGRFSIYDNTSGGHRLVIDPSGNVGIGTTKPSQKLSVNGTIRAKEVVIETAGWSDFVFEDDYQLISTSELELYIKNNKHLPGIPRATQVAASGVSVGELQQSLLAKIEELTLRQIAQEKRISTLEAENDRLRKTR